jgi:hypothetical protein
VELHNHFLENTPQLPSRIRKKKKKKGLDCIQKDQA